MSKLNIAVIGCGRIAINEHFPAFAQMDRIHVKYACDLIEEKALAMKEKYPDVEYAITDYHVALADPEVDAVYVLTPNFAHYTVTMDALKAGKHVFCEKPITVNYALSKEMADAANAAGKMLNIGVCNRFMKPIEELAQLNREGKFGNIYHVYCSFRGFRSIPGLGGAFTTKSQSGGGVLIDWGVHFFDLILYVLGDVKLKSLSCDAYCEMAKDMKAYKYEGMWAEETADFENGTNDVDDFIAGHIRTDKASITFNGAWAQNVKQTEMFVDFLGDKGGARWQNGGFYEFCDGATLETETPTYDIPNKYLAESESFVDSILTGVKGRTHIDRILETAKLLDALYQSAEKKAEVVLD